MRKQHEDYPPNTTAVRTTRKRAAKMGVAVPMREETPEEKEMMVFADEEVKVKPKIKRPIVRVKKKSWIQKLLGSIIGGDSGEGVGDYILTDVLVPAAKSTIQDMVTSGIEMLLFGETSGARRGVHRDRDRGTKVSYGSYFKDDRRDRRDSRRVPGYHNRLEGISFESRGEAESVLDALVDLLDEYENVSIADFYEQASIENMIEFTDNGWGWTNLARARIIRTRDGYEIEFPRLQRLD